MAIAFKSSGAGVGSESSGVAVSPLSPATVDAGDILLVHAYFEGLTTAPDTPSGFTLLAGPYTLDGSVGRHWLYGKIAAGSEDGAANALGSQAVTTMRSGICYSFSGRVSGTILQLVTDFAHTTETPAGGQAATPTGTTEAAGNMAVFVTAVHDNNAQASSTGESGGDWTEAVAETALSLTPGLSLGIQTCIPTADPGTVSGGLFTTGVDAAGMIAFQIAHTVTGALQPVVIIVGI